MNGLHTTVQLSKFAQFCASHNNAAGYIAAVNLVFCLSLSAAYLIQKDYRRSLYFLFAACITLTVVA